MSVDKQALLESLQFLVSAEDPHGPVTSLEAVLRVARVHPVKLTGELSALNPLLQLALEDREAFEKCKALVDRKREAAGKPLAWPPEPPETFSKAEYQRQLMAKRRERSGRAVDIENLQRDERDKLVGSRRLDFENHQLKVWGEQLRKILAAARTDAGGSISKEHELAIRTKFWDGVDVALDEKEELVRREMMLPAHQRRKY